MRAFILSLVTVTSLYAQPVSNWREYDDGGTRREKFFDIYALLDGGFVAVGESDTGWVKKLDAGGEPVWTFRRYDDVYYSIIESDNGDLIVGGMCNLNYGTARFNSAGEPIWRREFDAGLCSAVIELKGGDFISSGYTGNSARVIRQTGDGNVVWSRTFRIDEPGRLYILRTIRETDDGILLAGSYRHTLADGSRERGWVLKLNLEGNQVWTRSYEGRYWLQFQSMVSAPGGFVIAGNTTDTLLNRNETACAASLTKIDSEGRISFQRTYWQEDRAREFVFGINKLDDGGYCMVGRIDRSAPDPAIPFIIRTNSNGEVIWRSSYAEQMEGRHTHHQFWETELRSVVVVNRNEIVVCGGVASEDDRLGPSGLILHLEPDQLQPYIFRKSPEDSLQTLLAGDSITFVVRARDRQGHEMHYRWVYRDGPDSLEVDGNDTTVTIRYEQAGVTTLECWVSNDDYTVVTGWQVTSLDLLIRSHSPDTLSLTIHHGQTVPFGLFVAATPGDDPSYLWTLTDWTGGRFDTLGTDSIVSHLFDHGGTYLMEGMVSRGASADTVAWNIGVLSNVVAYHPDRTWMTFPQDTTVIFSVESSEFDTGQYRYEWLVDGVWCSDSASARVGFPFLGQSTVRAVVSDSAEADTIVWEVEVVERTSTPPTPPSIEGGDYPHKFTLSVSPNPFNHRTAIRYTVPSRGEVRVSVYDVSGRLVKELYRGDRYPGDYSILWQAPAAGVYLIQVETGGEIRRVVKAVCLP